MERRIPAVAAMWTTFSIGSRLKIRSTALASRILPGLNEQEVRMARGAVEVPALSLGAVVIVEVIEYDHAVAAP
jgi:hypothetical protein